ncbi:MAG TPA: cell wall hydrolase [Bacillota bacterium]|jgi:N-acetylmuramoyl-L-alanine amidase|nr:cell wall hydrolase [Bacillota bacterium]HOL10249.1 cell wall hydrolase [Bacillota bacterium]
MRALNLLIIFLLVIGGLFLFSHESEADWKYTVKRGDTLFNISKRTGVSVAAIKSRNGLSRDTLKIGQVLTIPTGTTSAGTQNTPSRSAGDLELLARVIHAEAQAEPYLGKVAVGGVILNRVQNPKFPKTIAGVIYQPHAFESVSNGWINKPASADSKKAAKDALSGWDPSGGALYFFNPAKTNNPWIWARKIINRIGKHVFAI